MKSMHMICGVYHAVVVQVEMAWRKAGPGSAFIH